MRLHALLGPVVIFNLLLFLVASCRLWTSKSVVTCEFQFEYLCGIYVAALHVQQVS